MHNLMKATIEIIEMHSRYRVHRYAFVCIDDINGASPY